MKSPSLVVVDVGDYFFSEIFRHDDLPAVGSSRGVAVYNNIKIIKNVD